MNGCWPSSSAVVGRIDGVYRSQIRGWAMDRAAPTSRLVVEAVGELGEPIAHALADRYRADVHKAGYGDGHYGFAIPCDNLMVAGKVKFLSGQPRLELLGELPGATGNQRTRTFKQSSYVLHLDQPPGGPCLTGWAVDRRHPGQRRQLRLRSGRQSLTEQRATLYRPDSIERDSDGFHGFSLPLPSDTGDLFVGDLVSGLEFRIS